MIGIEKAKARFSEKATAYAAKELGISESDVTEKLTYTAFSLTEEKDKEALSAFRDAIDMAFSELSDYGTSKLRAAGRPAQEIATIENGCQNDAAVARELAYSTTGQADYIRGEANLPEMPAEEKEKSGKGIVNYD